MPEVIATLLLAPARGFRTATTRELDDGRGFGVELIHLELGKETNLEIGCCGAGSLGRRQLTRDHFHQRGFASAVTTQYAESRARCYR